MQNFHIFYYTLSYLSYFNNMRVPIEKKTYLILINVICEFSLAELVEGDNDQGNEDVDEKEWKDDKVYNVEDGHLSPVPGVGSLVFVCRGHGVLQYTEILI